MRIAICQTVSGTDKEANLRQIGEFAEDAASRGAELAVFPEYAMYAAPDFTAEFIAQGEPLDGPFVQRLAGVARRTGMSIVAGMIETVPGEDRGWNSLVLVTPEGGLDRVYRKTHLYDAFGIKESDHIRPGDLEGPVTFTIGDVTVGLLTCYDLRFPEAARQHADAGTDVLVYPAAWGPGPRKEDHWKTLARARAIENTFYVAAVSQGPGIGTGGSLIVDPMGVTLAGLGEVSGVAIANIERERIASVRAVNPCLMNRRFAVTVA